MLVVYWSQNGYGRLEANWMRDCDRAIFSPGNRNQIDRNTLRPVYVHEGGLMYQQAKQLSALFREALREVANEDESLLWRMRWQ